MPRRLRKAAWIVLAVLLALVVLGKCALWWARSPSGRRTILAAAVPRLQKRLGGTLSIDRLEGNLTRGLVLRGVRFSDRAGRIVFSADKIAAEYDLAGLWSRELRIDWLDVRGASLRLRWPLERSTADASNEAGRFTILVRALRGEAEILVEGLPLELRGQLLVEAGGKAGGVSWSAASGLVLRDLGLRLAAQQRGELRLTAHVSTTPAGALAWHGEAEARDFDPGGLRQDLPHGRVELSASGQGEDGTGSLEIEKLDAKIAGTHLTAHGRLALDRTLSGDLRVEARSPDLSPLAAFGVPGLHGSLDAHAHLRRVGSADRLDATVNGHDLGIEGTRVEELHASAHATDRSLAIEADSRGPHGAVVRLRAHGTPLRAEGRWAAELTLDELEVDVSRQRWTLTAPGSLRVEPRHAYARLSLAVQLPSSKGAVDFTAELRGTLRAPEAQLQIDGHGWEVAGVDGLEFKLAADYAHRRVHANLDAQLRKAPLLHASAEAPLDAGRPESWRAAPLSAHAEIPSYDLSRIESLDGTLAGEAEIRGTLGHPELTAQLSATQASSGALHLDVRAAEELNATLKADGFALKATDLGNLRQLDGTLNANLRLSGPFHHPRLSGFAKVDGGAFALANNPRRYENVTLDLIAENDALVLRHLNLDIGRGKLSAHGRVALDGFHPSSVELSADTDKFPFLAGNPGAWLRAHAELRAHREDGVLTGTLTVSNGFAQLPRRDGRQLQSTAPLEDVVYLGRSAPQPRSGSPSETLNANVVAHIPGPFQVRSNEMAADLTGEIDVRIVEGVPRLYGHAETTWGRVDVLRRRYEVERARVDFDGQTEIDPKLDVRITRETAGATVAIELQGTAKNPEVVLSSEPPIYDSSQILGIIVSGDPNKQQVRSSSADQQIVGAVSGVLVGRLLDQVAPSLPIDVINIDTNNGRAGGGWGSTRLEVGRYLTEKIYVSYVHQFSTDMNGIHRLNTSEANVEWRFHHRASLHVRYGDAGVGVVELSWTVRF